MSDNDELFDGASDAPRKPAAQAGSFNLAGLFDEEEPQVPNVARPVPQSEAAAADVTSGAPAAEPLNEVQRPKPVRPLRADGSVDVARRSAEPLPAELPPAPPVVPLTRSADAATAAPAITEPLQWLKPSDIAEAATPVRAARPETRPSAQSAGRSSLGGLVQSVAGRPVDEPAEDVATVPAPPAPRPSRPIEHVRPQPVIRPVEASAAPEAPTQRVAAASAETPRSSANEVQWAPRRASSAPGPGAAALAAASAQPVDRAPAAAPVGATASAQPITRAAATPAQQPSRLTMTSRDWVVSVISLGITAAAIAGIFALLK